MAGKITRRAFSSGVLAGAVAMTRRSTLGALGANEKVGVGVIGVGNRGDQLIDAFKQQPDCQFTAICDVYQPHIDLALKKVGGNPFVTTDYRKLLERKDVDVVVIATPDHWHALQFIDACKAGKDVYVEKPLSLTIREGQLMVQAARKYNRITQVGTQRRSSAICQKAIEIVRSGQIGKVTAARCFHIRNETPYGLGNPADSDPPPGLDWDMWLGPAPYVKYNENRGMYKFRWFRPYSGGQLTNFGTHYIDLIQWAIGQDAPKGVFAIGGRYVVPDNRDVPDTMEAIWEYDGVLVTFSQFNGNGAPGTAVGSAVEIRGTEGTVYCGGDRLEVVPETQYVEDIPATGPILRASRKRVGTRKVGPQISERGSVDGDPPHARNFLDCVKSRKETNCPVEVGHRSTSTTLLANLAYDRKRYLLWDAEKEEFTNDPEANKLLHYEYRAPWKLEL